MTKRHDPGGGGLTGVTGDLTPDESAEPFVPGERLAQAGDVEDRTELGGRESDGPGADEPPPAPEPRQGVDDVTDHEERF